MTEPKIYKPEILSRQSELNAWLLTLIACLGLFFLSRQSVIPYWAWFLSGLLAFSALSMSLGSWMDRKSFIQINGDSIRFENGLRKVEFAWDDILEVRTAVIRWGTSVQVFSRGSHFSFSTLGEMKFQGEVRGKTGYSRGVEIMDTILQNSRLFHTERNGSQVIYSRN
ncbi:MAG: hypothetical protein WCP19_06555 [Chloroflexota bacterium]